MGRSADDDAAPTLLIDGRLKLEPLDAQTAGAWREDLCKAAAAGGAPRLAALMQAAGRSADAAGNALAALMDLSPYLNVQMLQHPEWLEALFDATVDERIERVTRTVDAMPQSGTDEAGLMRALRLAKRETSLLIALDDLFGAAGVARTTARLSRLADAAVSAALRFCLLEAQRKGSIALPDPERPQTGSGLFVLGMGKLGGGELNYSSDVDLVVFFDAAACVCTDPAEAVDTFSRLVRRLVRILSERTADGYVFRVDLRLRPDPGATPMAISTDAALSYYEGSGRNWERAAMIKARVVAGDAKAGNGFLQELTPFIWRRYLDFAAIGDIEAMKTRIDEHRGFDAIAVAGHNVKLGRGGIREIEFFVQAQQLIAGGRMPALRTRRTDDALDELVRGGWIAPAARDEIVDDYWFLRRIEHAIQMVADEQSHTLPADEEGLTRIARLCGHGDRETFEAALVACLRRVDRHYTSLFSAARNRGADDPGSAVPDFKRLLSFDDDPDGLGALERLGYRRPQDVARMVRSWGAGRYRATRSQVSRERLSKLLGHLLAAFADARDPDAAIAAFDTFLSGLPAGIQFFSLIANNPRILDLLALIITSAPALRDTIAARPHVFDALLDPAFFDEVPDRELMRQRLSLFLADANGYEDILGRLRIFASEQRFLVGTRVLSGVVDVREAGPAFSNIADVVLDATLKAVSATFAERHGTIAGSRVALLGMGRLGSRELTATSDIDLILIYDHDDEAETSDGEKPLAASLYFARLTQRLIAALSAPMGEGILYEVDFRLRPSGNAGPLATRVASFLRYQETEAWTWEHMALTRSRPIAGDPSLCTDLSEGVVAILTPPQRDRRAIDADVARMRERIERDKPARGDLDLKLLPGGLIDLEFLAQWALVTGEVGAEFVGDPTEAVLAAAQAGFSARLGRSVDLASSMAALSGVVQVLRLGPPSTTRLEDLPPALSSRIADALGLAGVDDLATFLQSLRRGVRRDFEALLPMAGAAEKPA